MIEDAYDKVIPIRPADADQRWLNNVQLHINMAKVENHLELNSGLEHRVFLMEGQREVALVDLKVVYLRNKCAIKWRHTTKHALNRSGQRLRSKKTYTKNLRLKLLA